MTIFASTWASTLQYGESDVPRQRQNMNKPMPRLSQRTIDPAQVRSKSQRGLSHLQRCPPIQSQSFFESLDHEFFFWDRRRGRSHFRWWMMIDDSKMVRLITHNLLACHAKGCTSNNFPLQLKDAQIALREADFNADFIRGFIPKIEWNALVNAARQVFYCSLFRVDQQLLPLYSWEILHCPLSSQRWQTTIYSRLSTMCYSR